MQKSNSKVDNNHWIRKRIIDLGDLILLSTSEIRHVAIRFSAHRLQKYRRQSPNAILSMTERQSSPKLKKMYQTYHYHPKRNI